MIEQRTEEWRKARLGMPTASQFDRVVTPKGVLSEKRYLYAGELIAERIFGRSMAKDVSRYEAVKWGVEHEDEAANALAERIGELQPGGFWTDNDIKPRYGASPDRLLIHGNRQEVCEIKCPQIPTHVRNVLFGMPDEHRTQIQGQLLVSGFDLAHFWSYHPDCPPCYEKVPRDERFIEALRRGLDEFCDELDKAERRARKMGGWNGVA